MIEYINRIPEDDFQVCSKHERVERGNVSEPTANTLKGAGFEFCEFSLIKSLLTKSRFTLYHTSLIQHQSCPQQQKIPGHRMDNERIEVRLKAEVRNRLSSGAYIRALDPKKYPIQWVSGSLSPEDKGALASK